MKSKTIPIFLLAFLIISTQGLAQDWQESQRNLIKNLSFLRSKILLKDTLSLKQMEKVLSKISNANASKEDRDDFISHLALAINYQSRYKYFTKRCRKDIPENSLLNILSKEEYQCTLPNIELLELWYISMIELKYPYKLEMDSLVLEELKYYQINKNETIAEIGAGLGSFSKLLFLLDLSNNIFINDISFFQLQGIELSINALKKNFDTKNLHLVKGKKKETNLDSKVDKIIIRNSFHHFKFKDEMQLSLYNSLEDKGLLFIYETPKEHYSKGCNKQLSLKELTDSIDKNLFEIVEIKDMSEDKVLKLVKIR